MAIPMQREGPFAGGGASPRLVNVALGVWLFISAFTWHHTHAQMTNAWICGVLCVAFAIIGIGVPWARYLNTALAVWLFVTAWALPPEAFSSIATVWNNVLCAIAIFVVSLVPSSTMNLPSGLTRVTRPRTA
jgi:hypothetical protein